MILIKDFKYFIIVVSNQGSIDIYLSFYIKTCCLLQKYCPVLACFEELISNNPGFTFKFHNRIAFNNLLIFKYILNILYQFPDFFALSPIFTILIGRCQNHYLERLQIYFVQVIRFYCWMMKMSLFNKVLTSHQFSLYYRNSCSCGCIYLDLIQGLH